MIYRILLVPCLSLAALAMLIPAATADEASKPSVSGPAAPAPPPPLPGPRHLLRYKFKPGETIRWNVEHRAEVRTTVSGTTQTAETVSNSVKVWKVTAIDVDKKQARFVHSVDSVDMRQVLSGRQEVRYNSLTDPVPPPGFEDVAKDVGVPLSEFTIDLRGYVLRREEKRKEGQGGVGEITIPLPDNPVAVGETWSQPNQVTVKYKDGSPKVVKTRQDYQLKEVDKGVATIRLETAIITPITDPAIDAQLIQQVVDGTIRFDIEAGRVISQQTDIDKHVVGFQGEASSLHYITRFKENLASGQGTVSAKAPTGPALPPTLAPKTTPAPKTAQAPAAKPVPKTAQAPKATPVPKTAQAPVKKPDSVKAPTATKQPATKPPATSKAPAAQTARGPAKKTTAPPAKKPATEAKPTADKAATPNKTTERSKETSTSPWAKKSDTWIAPHFILDTF